MGKTNEKRIKEEEAILRFLADKDWTSPSVIGGTKGPGGRITKIRLHGQVPGVGSSWKTGFWNGMAGVTTG